MKNKSVAVVGAGFTGLTAAYELSKKGAKVTVYEAGSVAGGLAGGSRILGQPIEKAYHFLYKTDEYILALLQELGIADQLTYHKSSVSTFYDGRLYPMMNPIDLLKFTPLKFHNRIRAGLVVLYLQQVRNWQKLTEIPAVDWLRKYAGDEVTDVIWEPLLKGKFDRYYDKVTMCWLWGRVKQRADSRDRKLGGEALGYFEGGFELIVSKLIERIERSGSRIEYHSPIEHITHCKESGRVRLGVKGQEQEFDDVLLTVPCQVAAKMLAEYEGESPDFFRRLRSVDYLDAAVMLFATDRPITKYYWHNINTPDAPFVVFISLTSLIGTERFGGKHVYYIGDYIPREHEHMQSSPDELSAKWFAALKDICPDFDASSVIEKQVYRFANAQHIVDVGFEDKIVPHRTPCPGVYLCNFSQIFPMDRGTNYAVRDGVRMAELIESDSI